MKNKLYKWIKLFLPNQSPSAHCFDMLLKRHDVSEQLSLIEIIFNSKYIQDEAINLDYYIFLMFVHIHLCTHHYIEL